MDMLLNKSRQSLAVSIALTVVVAAGCATTMEMNQGLRISLSGNQEVPPVSTTANGHGTITVSTDKSVSGSITTSGIDAKGAHIHEGARDKNGPVIIPLNKTADNIWSVPDGAKLTNAQYASYMAGNLYVNVHSAANPGGEIRAQLTLPIKRSDRAGY